MPDRELYEFGPYRLDPAERLLLHGGEPVLLEPKVFETLVALVRRGGRLVGKDELMREVWPDSYVEEGNLTRNISVLRKALQQNDGGPSYIETVPKRGYRFVGEVRAIPGEGAELVVERSKVSVVVEEEESDEQGDEAMQGNDAATMAPKSAAAVERKRLPSGRLRRRGLGVALALALAATVGAAAYFGRSGGSGRAIDSLAVLPLVNEDAEPDTEILADGVTESLINNLSQLPGLRVMSRNAVFRYKGRETGAREAARQLGVQAVLTGRVAPRGDGLSINLELVDARDDRQLWGAQYSRQLSELAEAQAVIARDVAEKLHLTLSSEARRRLTRRGTENPEALEAYLKGRHHFNTLTNDGVKQSIEYFRRAVEIDPHYAAAYAGLAAAYAEMGNLGSTFLLPPKEAYSRAKEAALKAVGLDDTLAEAHASLGLIAMSYEWDWDGVERHFKRAIELNPNYLNARHSYSHYLINMGRFDESLAQSQHALALDPLDVGMTLHLGFHYLNARQYEQAEAQLLKALEMNPNHSEVHNILSGVYQQTGRLDEAIAALHKGRDLGGLDTRGSLGHVYARAGRRDEARRLLAQLQEESKHTTVSAYNIAKIYEGLGEKDEAFAWLEKAYAERDSNVTSLKADQAFDGLRSDPRYADLLRRIGLPL